MRPQSESAIALETLLNGVNTNGNTNDNIEDINNQATSESGRGLFFEFEKLYDANWSAEHPEHYPSNMSNELRGDCQKGQLILAGHGQQIINGKLIQQAYIMRDELGFNQPDVGTLFDFNEEKVGEKTFVNKRAYDEPQLYFRSDDDERTLMSGSFLLQQVFDELMTSHEETYKNEGKDVDRPVIRLHTADRNRDVLAPNHETCPRLTELMDEAVESKGFKEQFETSEEAVLMMKLAKDHFGGENFMQNPDEAIDCVMTTVCEDKTLPYVLDVDLSGNDPDLEEKYGKNILDRYIEFVSLIL